MPDPTPTAVCGALPPNVVNPVGCLLEAGHEGECYSSTGCEGSEKRWTAPSMTEQMADQETDPVRSWMLRYPDDNTIGPGWGAAEAVEDGLACPWCHGSLADHNAAMRAQAQAHTLAALQRAATDPVRPLSRFGVTLPKPEDPWAYPIPWQVLHTGLRAIAATAVARDDYATAAYAFSVLAGEPLPAPTEEEEDEQDDDGGPETTEPATTCGARPHGPGLRPPVGCDRPAGHDHGPHSASYDTGHDGWTTITWDGAGN